MGAVMVYTVRTECPDEQTRQRYVDWLTGGHAAALVHEGGALRAEVAVLDDGTVETRYLFASREAFAAYEAGAAVELRKDGAVRFPPEAGVRMSRSTGEIRGVVDAD